MKRLALLYFACILAVASAKAQQWTQIHRTYNKVGWKVPLRIDGYSHYMIDATSKQLQSHHMRKDSTDLMVPFKMEEIDSISFAYSLTDEEKGHNRFRCFAMYISTDGQQSITEKEVWQDCHIAIDGMGEYDNYSGTGRIRGRGNSSWEWYEKKPYKIKLDSKHKLLGLDKAKDWNLMANYRDVTDLMNALAFETARYMGMPHTNHTRYVELFLNGEYIGLYQLTEKIEVDDNRVDIDREGGVMLSFDQDDGPSLSPNATDNFWSTVYSLPMCVKYPDDPTAEQLAQAKADFTVLEKAIKAQNFAMVDSLMDVSSFISILQLHEYLYNVEIDAPRSLYMYRDKDGKYTFGPVWDWDAAFDFDWGNMYTGHTFFSDYRELIYGTDPYRNTGAAYRVSGFFTDLFNCAGFVTRYKEQWNAVKDSIYLHPWAEAQQWANELNKGAYSRDLARWPISGKKTTSEISKMSQWLQNRLNYLNSVIANYPAGQKGGDDPEEDPTTVTVLNKTMNCYHNLGYSQNEQVVVSQSEVEQLLGGTPTALVPLNADGQEGSNTAAGTYGAWFNSEGSTGDWGAGHIYIESDDLWTWNFGCHPDNCKAGDKHMVTMQYQLGNKRVNVSVTFNLYESADDAPDDPSEDPTIIATLEKTAECTFSQGYKQSAKITVSQSEVELLLGGTPTALVPLNSDGQEGSNTAAGTYGAWFNSEGSTAKWALGHVYIESDNMWIWNYGCHPDNCSAGDKHTVTMQYQLGSKRVNVSVTFNLQ